MITENSFADIFKDYEYDFFHTKLLLNLFSPSKVIISNMRTGNTFISGKIDNDLMKKSLDYKNVHYFYGR